MSYRQSSTNLLFVLLSVFFSSVVWAGVGVAPIRPVIEYKQKTAQVFVTNDGEEDQVFDVNVYAWKRQNELGQDELEPTDAVVPSLPVLLVRAKETYVLRLIANYRSTAAQDTYRLELRNITPSKRLPDDNEQSDMATTQIGAKLSTIMPVFVMNDKSSRGKFELSNGVIKNIGGRTIRLSKWETSKGEKKSGLLYLLPYQSLSLDIANLDSVQAYYEMY